MRISKKPEKSSKRGPAKVSHLSAPIPCWRSLIQQLAAHADIIYAMKKKKQPDGDVTPG